MLLISFNNRSSVFFSIYWFDLYDGCVSCNDEKSGVEPGGSYTNLAGSNSIDKYRLDLYTAEGIIN